MSLRSKLFAVVFAVSAFAVAGFAQEVKETPKEGDAKLERGAARRDGLDKGMHGGGFGRHGGRMGRFGMHSIDLTDAQKDQIRQILEANKPDPAVLQEARTILRAKWAGTATAEQEARLQVLKTQAREKAQSVHQQIKAVFTPEQKAQIEQRKQEMKQKMQELRQRRQEMRQLRQKDTPKVVTKDN